jgi:hypothetical protein
VFLWENQLELVDFPVPYNGHQCHKTLVPLNFQSISPHCYDWFTLWLFSIAMENGSFIDGLPINSMVIFHGELLINLMV